MSNILKNIAWWIGLLTLQMVLLFYFRPTMVYTPYIYLLLLVRIPHTFPRIGLLIIAFCTGLFIDAFTNSWGIHAFSAVFITFTLPAFVSIFSQQALSEESKFSIQAMGGFRYGIALLGVFFIYHLLVLVLWNFSFNLILTHSLRALLTSIIALVIVLVLHSLFRPKIEEENG